MDLRTRLAAPSGEQTPLWGLGYLDVAEKDARRYLNDDQYAHVVELFDQLACEQNPRLSDTQDIRPIDQFFELRDKGGILGKINLRVYFAVFDEEKLLVALGCRKKEEEHQVPAFVVVKMRNRFRVAKRLAKNARTQEKP